jgi:acetyl-CoA carboxylase carboxyltransferase component
VSERSDDWNGWKPLLDELESRLARARAMGGPERIQRLQVARGRLDARQRLERLFDPGSFTEIGALVGGVDVPADATVTGAGSIHGRPPPRTSRSWAAPSGSAPWRNAIGSASSPDRNAHRW